MGSPPGPVLGRTSIDDAAGGSEEVLRRLSVNGDAGVVARDPRPYLDKHPFRNMSLKQIKAYKGLTHTKNPNHNAKVIKTRMCTLLKLIAQLEATAIHHLVAHGWDLVAATVTHRANTKLLRDAFEVEYDVTNNARRNFLSGYLVPLPYIEKDISPPRQIRPPMRPSAINDESPEATKNRGDHPYQPSIALTATVNQTVSQTDGPSTAIVAQSMAAGPSSDPFSLTNRPNTLAYLAVYREVTRVATAKSLRMFLIHHKWDCNKAVLAYTQHPNCLERVKVAGMMGVNPSHLLLHIDDPSLAMYADHINGFATGLDRLGVKFNFDVALYCLRAASWNLKEALADYDRKEQMFAARCARIPEEAEPDFEDDGSDVEDALGVVRRHGEPTPEPTFDSDSESGSEEPSTNIYDRFDGTASEGSPCPEGGDTSEAPDFLIPRSARWWLAPISAWETATSYLNNPQPSFLYYEKERYGQLRWHKYKKMDELDWSSMESLKRLDVWRRQVRKAFPGATLLRDAPVPYLAEETDYLRQIREAAQPGFRWDYLQGLFNERFAGKVLEGCETARPWRSVSSLSGQWGRKGAGGKVGGKEARGTTEGKTAGGKLMLRLKGAKRAAEEMEEGEGSGEPSKRFKGDEEDEDEGEGGEDLAV